MSVATQRSEQLVGSILRTAVGDSLGLPFEGMSRRRVRRTARVTGPSHGFFGRRGMVSDDTEHTCLVAHALAVSRGDIGQFRRVLSWSLRWWLFGLPAGIGWGTLRALVRLWLGFGERSGVWSAGNGPAMRAAIVGVYASGDQQLRAGLVKASTRLTHTDPQAEQGALAGAHAAALSTDRLPASSAERIRAVRELLGDCELVELLVLAEKYADQPTEQLADALGLQSGVSGFINHTVPIAIHVWARHADGFEAAMEEVIRLGGDTDTTAAIVGGMLGARARPAGIPVAWRDGIWEWPRSVGWMTSLGEALAAHSSPPSLRWPAAFLRNVVFTIGVYWLIVRRGLPPY